MRSNHQHHIYPAGHLGNGVLPVGGGIANVVAHHGGGEPLPDAVNHSRGVAYGQGSLGNNCHLGVRRPVNVGADRLLGQRSRIVHQGHRSLPHRSVHFLMPAVPYQQNPLALSMVLLGLVMHPRNQRAYRVNDPQAARPGPFKILRRRAVGGKHHQRPVGHFVHCLNRNRALVLQFRHHIGVMHNLVLDIHRWPEPFQAQLNNLNRAHHPGAETPRRTENNLNHNTS